MQDNIKPQLIIQKSLLDKRDYKYETIFAKQLGNTNTLPRTLDYRNILLNVRNQGTQGSCAAMSASCIKEYQEYKDAFKETHKLYFSPQFIYNNRSNQDGYGMYTRDLMKILHKLGCCLEDTYPYGRIEKPADIDKYIYDEASNYKISAYSSIDTITATKHALVNNGPCLISLPVFNYDGDFWNKSETYNKLIGGHAVVIVGYNTDGFILRNSWGNKWNGNGYAVFPYKQWGKQWEIWTTIDEPSDVDLDKLPNNKLKCCTFL